MGVAQIEYSRSFVSIPSCNKQAIRANVDEPSDVSVCHANDSYKVKSIPEIKLFQLAGNLIPLLRYSERCEDEEIGLLHQLIT